MPPKSVGPLWLLFHAAEAFGGAPSCSSEWLGDKCLLTSCRSLLVSLSKATLGDPGLQYGQEKACGSLRETERSTIESDLGLCV